MSKSKTLGETVVKSVRLELEMDRMLIDLAALETIRTGKNVTQMDLIRMAIDYTFTDNERLRECFRRTRHSANTRFK